MNRLKPWMIGSALMVGVGALGLGNGLKPAAGIPEASPWLSNYDTAKSIARQSGKPIFLVIR